MEVKNLVPPTEHNWNELIWYFSSSVSIFLCIFQYRTLIVGLKLLITKVQQVPVLAWNHPKMWRQMNQDQDLVINCNIWTLAVKNFRIPFSHYILNPWHSWSNKSLWLCLVARPEGNQKTRTKARQPVSEDKSARKRGLVC